MVAFTRLLLAGSVLVGSVFAQQDTSGIVDIVTKTPPCAIHCFIDAITPANCSLASTAALAECICTNYNLQSTAATCVQKSCKFDAQLVARNITLFSLCRGYPQEERTAIVRDIAILGLVLTIPVVVLRCASRLYSSGKLWWDDYTCLVASTFLVGMLGMQIQSAKLGFGVHIWAIEQEPGLSLLKYFWVGQIMYIVVQVFAKVSILILYMRLFQTRWFQWTVKCGIAFMLSHGAAYIILVVFQCTPISAAWDREVEGTCINFQIIVYSGAALSVFEDVVLVLIPIPELMTLCLNRKKKLGLILMFTIGLVATVTSIVRINYLVKIGFTYDQSWDNVDPIVWSTVEEFCAIICGSLPSCRAILTYIHSKIRTNVDNNSLPHGGPSGSLQNPHPGSANKNSHSDLALAARERDRRKRFSLYRLTTEIDPRDLDYYNIDDDDDNTALDRVDEVDSSSCDSSFIDKPARRHTEYRARADDPEMVSVQIRSPGEVVEMARRRSSDIRPHSLAATLGRQSTHRTVSVIGSAWMSAESSQDNDDGTHTLPSDIPAVPSIPELTLDSIQWPLPGGASGTLVASASGRSTGCGGGSDMSTNLGSEGPPSG